MKNVNISGFDEHSSNKFGGQIHHGNMEMIASTLTTEMLNEAEIEAEARTLRSRPRPRPIVPFVLGAFCHLFNKRILDWIGYHSVVHTGMTHKQFIDSSFTFRFNFVCFAYFT